MLQCLRYSSNQFWQNPKSFSVDRCYSAIPAPVIFVNYGSAAKTEMDTALSDFGSGGRVFKVKTHRLAFYLKNNFPIMKGMHVSHICHTEDCITVCRLSLETVAVNNKRKICVYNGECTGHYGYKRCTLRYWSYLLMLVPYACSFEVSSDTFSYIEFACSFLQHFFFLDKCRKSLYCLDLFLCEWQSVLASIFNICLYMRYVAFYLIPIPEAIAREDLPVPKVLECTAEWRRSVKFRLHMVLFGAYVKTRWCKLTDWFDVESRQTFSTCSTEKSLRSMALIWFMSALFKSMCLS